MPEPAPESATTPSLSPTTSSTTSDVRPEAATPLEPEAPPPPSWAAQLLAGVLTFIGAAHVLALTALVVAAAGDDLTWDSLELRAVEPSLLAGGALVGVVWGAATGLAARGRLRLGVAAVAIAGALGPLAVRFALALFKRGNSLDAIDEVLSELQDRTDSVVVDAAVGIATALALGGPLLVARTLGARRRVQSVALALGGVAWLGGLLVWPPRVQGGGRPFELVVRLAELVFRDQRWLGVDRYDLIETTVRVLALWFVQVLTLPAQLGWVETGVDRLFERAGLDERHDRAPPAVAWPAIRRRAYVAFAVLLLIELTLVPGVAGGRVACDAAVRWRLERRASAGDLDADLDLAERCSRAGDPATELDHLRRAANRGSVEAMHALVDELAWRGRQDAGQVAEAFDWAARLDAAAPPARGGYGLRLATRFPRDARARPHLQAEVAAVESQLALTVVPSSQKVFWLAQLEEWLGDTDAAAAVLRRPAFANDPLVVERLAELLEARHGPGDEAEAVRLYEKVWALLTGRSDVACQAAWRLGRIAEEGRDGPASPARAALWYRRSLAIFSGEFEARAGLARLIGAGLVSAEDPDAVAPVDSSLSSGGR